MIRALLLGTVAAVALTATASAADLPSRKAPVAYAPAPAYAYSWTGFYLGVTAGANWNNSNVQIPAYPSNFNIKTTALSLGAKAGYNQQFGAFVAGLEASGAFVFNKGTHLSGAGAELYRVNQNFAGAVVGKLGVAMDRTLFYVKGGVAFANLNKNEFIPLAGGTWSSSRTGWTLGAGVDYALTNNWILGLDYAYSDFSRKSHTYLGPVSVRPTTHAVNLSLSYKFGGPSAVVAKY